MERKQYMEGLILQKLRQEISADQYAELQQWLDEDPAHLQELRDLERIWEDSLPVLNQQVFNTRAAWAKVNATIRNLHDQEEARDHGDERSGRVVVLRKRWLAAASIILVLVVGGWWLHSAYNSKQIQQFAALDQDMHITLPDGSQADLRKGATLRYSKDFGQSGRSVELQGEAFFNVIHHPEESFSVHTQLATIEDVGTSFLVKNMDSTLKVVVSSGKVKLTSSVDIISSMGVGRSLFLAAGEMIELSKTGSLQHQSADSNALAWKTQVLVFKNTPLDAFVNVINDQYHVTLAQSPQLQADTGKILLTARFEKQSLQEILSEVKLMTGLEIRKERDTLWFFRK